MHYEKFDKKESAFDEEQSYDGSLVKSRGGPRFRGSLGMGDMAHGTCVFVFAALLLFSKGVAAQDADLKAAVDACIGESSSGDCKCANGCGNYQGTIRQWDVSGVTRMFKLFYDKTRFNADISKWDTSRVTNMEKMWVSLFHLINTELG